MQYEENDKTLMTQIVGEKSYRQPTGFAFLSEEEKLLKDAMRSDIEKLQLFTRMLKRNAMLKHLIKQ